MRWQAIIRMQYGDQYSVRWRLSLPKWCTGFRASEFPSPSTLQRSHPERRLAQRISPWARATPSQCHPVSEEIPVHHFFVPLPLPLPLPSSSSPPHHKSLTTCSSSSSTSLLQRSMLFGHNRTSVPPRSDSCPSPLQFILL